MDDEAARLRELWSRDMTVRASQARTTPDGKFQGLPSFEYSIGSDGRVYATGDPPPSYIEETAIQAAVAAAHAEEDAPMLEPVAERVVDDPAAQGAERAVAADDARVLRRTTRLYGSIDESDVDVTRAEPANREDPPLKVAGSGSAVANDDDDRGQREVVHAYRQLEESPPAQRPFEAIA